MFCMFLCEMDVKKIANDTGIVCVKKEFFLMSEVLKTHLICNNYLYLLLIDVFNSCLI